MEEIWKDIEGYIGLYQVSNLGRVKSKRGVLKSQKSNVGYLRYALWKGNKSKNFSSHRLVAKAFILNPEGKKEVNHIDGNKNNNKVDNLQWITSSENQRHAFDTGLQVSIKGSKHYNTKLTEEDVLDIRASNQRQKELAHQYKISRATIGDITYRRTWKHI